MGMIFKGLTFGGVNSLDYGIFITGEAVYNAPERSVTSIEIEGRNGDLLIDNGRFLNIEIKYPAGCFAETQEDFKQKIESFRNAIISQISYQRLTDDYNPDEYRLAVYKSGLDVSVAVLHQGGEFNLTFDCEPQRFLTSGETERSIPEWSDLHTDSGSLVTVDNTSGEYAVKSLSTDIVPQQSGSGVPSPTNIRPITGFNSANIYSSGKNMLRHIFPSETKNGVTFTENANGTISTSGTATANAEHSLTYRVSGTYGTCFLKAGTYILSGCPSGGGSTKYEIGLNTTVNDSGVTLARDYGNGATFTMQNDGYVGTWVTIRNGQDASGLTFKPMIEQGSTATAYEKYKGNTYSVSFGSAGTVYGGTLDVVTGELKSCPYYSSYNGEALTGEWISDRDVYAVGTTPTTGAQVVNIGGTLTTYQLTHAQVTFLLGTNNLWSNTGDIQIEYGKGGNTLFNPTLFDSKPLLVVTGYGNLGIGSQTLTIENGYPSQVVYIDCDSMEAWTESGGVKSPANDLIQNAGDAFPVLKSGVNVFSLPVTITSLKVTPRWWRI